MKVTTAACKYVLAAVAWFCSFSLIAQEKVALEEPKQPDLVAELVNQPDGVLGIKTNEDGTFKSLMVKATVEIEDVLGAAKGKQLARKEAETKCKQALAKFFQEECLFVESTNNTTAIETKGESSKDAAGNTVKIRSQQGVEIKARSEISASKAQALLRGMIVLHSEVTDAQDPEYVLVMGINRSTLEQAGAVADALSGKENRAAVSPQGAQGSAATDKPAAERKTNPLLKDF